MFTPREGRRDAGFSLTPLHSLHEQQERWQEALDQLMCSLKQVPDRLAASASLMLPQISFRVCGVNVRLQKKKKKNVKRLKKSGFVNTTKACEWCVHRVGHRAQYAHHSFDPSALTRSSPSWRRETTRCVAPLDGFFKKCFLSPSHSREARVC